APHSDRGKMNRRIFIRWLSIPVVTATAVLACARTQTDSATSQTSTESPWIDATATLDPATTPVYQGDAPMKFDFLHDMRKGDGFTLSAYSMGAHSGTHIDAPMHFIRDGASIERVPIDALIGPARIIDIPDSVQAIDSRALASANWKGAERVIFRTRSALHGWMHAPAF